MTVVGVTMVKDEADVIETTLRHMLMQVDCISVFDNMSTDGTTEIIQRLIVEDDARDDVKRGPRYHSRIALYMDDDPAYYQSRKVTRLAQHARDDFGADWVVPFDADEIWTWQEGRIGDLLDSMPDETFVVHANVYDHVCTGIDSKTGDPFRDIAWRTRDKLELPKAALRLTPDLVIRAGNHGGDYDESRPTIGAYLADELLQVDHFPYRSPEQFVRKVRNGYNAYKLTDLDENTGTHWRNYGRILEEKGAQILVGDVFYRWFYEIDPTVRCDLRPLVRDTVLQRLQTTGGSRTGGARGSTR